MYRREQRHLAGPICQSLRGGGRSPSERSNVGRASATAGVVVNAVFVRPQVVGISRVRRMNERSELPLVLSAEAELKYGGVWALLVVVFNVVLLELCVCVVGDVRADWDQYRLLTLPLNSRE